MHSVTHFKERLAPQRPAEYISSMSEHLPLREICPIKKHVSACESFEALGKHRGQHLDSCSISDICDVPLMRDGNSPASKASRGHIYYSYTLLALGEILKEKKKNYRCKSRSVGCLEMALLIWGEHWKALQGATKTDGATWRLAPQVFSLINITWEGVLLYWLSTRVWCGSRHNVLRPTGV